MLESLEVREESNIDAVIVRGNHFLQVSREKPFRIHANVRTVVTGKLPHLSLLYPVSDFPIVKTCLLISHQICLL